MNEAQLSLDSLPDELICHIVDFFHPEFETHSLSCVSRRFQALVQDVRPKTQTVCEAALRSSVCWEPYMHPGTTPPRARWSHSMTRVGDNVFVFGGASHGASLFYNDLHRLDLVTHAWSRLAPSGTPPHPRGFATLLPFQRCQKLLVFGGQFNRTTPEAGWTATQWEFFNDCTVLDLVTMTWQPLVTSGDVPPPRVGHRAVMLDDDVLLVFGGTFVEYGEQHPNGNVYRYFNDLFTLDLRTARWRKIDATGDVPSPRHSTVMTAHGGRVLMFGGNGNVHRGDTDSHNDLHVLDLATMAWRLVETGLVNRPDPAWCSSSLRLGDSWAIIGGFATLGDVVLSHIRVLDLNTFEWSMPKVSGRVPQARVFQAGVFVADGWLMFGGSKGVRDFGDCSLLRLRGTPAPDLAWNDAEFALAFDLDSLSL
eukprot:TRINITY_DN31659_c0_g1_i1.p1 TRINITY_DN31659_c0_g1~~TRINITY_DN31659_c0_g1_i1.p1  ORF type:complete len:423 (+),score=123.37 TRINITY_DN31659_c0_g1_i1:112-1380(+)